MTGIGLDGSQGFASNLWDMIADGGVWMIPRCGVVFRKDAASKTMTVVERMPWHPAMPITEAELDEYQADDIEGCTAMFASIGVTVMPFEI